MSTITLLAIGFTGGYAYALFAGHLAGAIQGARLAGRYWRLRRLRRIDKLAAAHIELAATALAENDPFDIGELTVGEYVER